MFLNIDVDKKLVHGHLICQLSLTSIKITAFCHSLNTDPAIFRKCPSLLIMQLTINPYHQTLSVLNEGGDFRTYAQCTTMNKRLFIYL